MKKRFTEEQITVFQLHDNHKHRAGGRSGASIRVADYGRLPPDAILHPLAAFRSVAVGPGCNRK
jgi:hypothetical protein